MEEYVLVDGKRLRLGYTTGSCAAAASKAAVFMLLSGKRREKITLLTPKGIILDLDIHEITVGEDFVRCAVKKDAGDDPDVTGGTLIFAEVRKTESPGVTIDGGFGVGRVTKPGLDQPVGAAAINSVPRKMITENVEEVCRLLDYAGGISVVITVPEGEALAKKTFNPRLGIEGGISIIGTTGIVEPMSEKALVDAIIVELRQRRAQGADYALLTPGNYGSDFIKDGLGLDPERAVMTSNFIGDCLDACRDLGYKGALLVGHVGKLVKLAGGMFNTHSKYGDCRMDILAACAGARGLNKEGVAAVLDCVMVDEALRVIGEAGLRNEVLTLLSERVDDMLSHRCGEDFSCGAIVFSKVGGELCRTKKAGELLKIISEG